MKKRIEEKAERALFRLMFENSKLSKVEFAAKLCIGNELVAERQINDKLSNSGHWFSESRFVQMRKKAEQFEWIDPHPAHRVDLFRKKRGRPKLIEDKLGDDGLPLDMPAELKKTYLFEEEFLLALTKIIEHKCHEIYLNSATDQQKLIAMRDYLFAEIEERMKIPMDDRLIQTKDTI